MHTLISELRHVPDPELVARLASLRGEERHVTARTIAHIAEVERRELHLALGYPSLFAYCQRALGYSEAESYGRIEAARCARAWPLALDLLLDGTLTMTAIGLLRPHLTESNHREVLLAARGKPKGEVEIIVASLRPKPDAPVLLRREARPAVAQPAGPVLPAAPPVAAQPPATPGRPAPVPLAPERFRYQLTIDDETRALLTRARELSSAPDAELLKKALGLLVADLERRKLARTSRPAASPRPSDPDARGVVAEVRRSTSDRAQDQCEFVGSTGVRCTEREGLEFHHTDPWAAGGEGTAAKVELRCRRHNQYEARLFFERDADGAPRLERPVRWSAPRAQQLGLERVVAATDERVGGTSRCT